MNTSNTDQRLRDEVDKIVQPIRAMAWRKGRMREELLGHLQQLVDQEGGLEEAMKRFGDPQALCSQLQAGVPAIERFLLTVSQRFVVGGPNERSIRMVLRIFLLVLCFQKLVDGTCLFSPQLAEWVLSLIAGAGVYSLSDAAPELLARLWGCASLVWAYALFRASLDPRRHVVVFEASIIGFFTGAVVALSVPNAGVKLCGWIFIVEGLLLLWGRLTLAKKRAPLSAAGDENPQEDPIVVGRFEAQSAISD
jgi:hypothetical protein